MNELRILISEFNFQVLCVTETHLDDTIFDAEISLENYNIFRRDRTNSMEGGGSIIYVHKSINAYSISTFNAPDSLAIMIDIPDNSFIMACIYRSQCLTNDENFKIIQELDRLSGQKDTDVMVVGD